MNSRKLKAAVLAALATCTVIAPAAAASTAQRGDVVSVTTVDQIGADKVASYLTAAHLDPGRARYGVRAERVVYRTITPRGLPTTASELVVRPVKDTGVLKTVAWMHGTMVFRSDTASVDPTDSDRAYAVMFASAGYLTSAPDYLGLGTGPGTHPYLDVRSETTAAIDAVRASRTLAARAGQRLDKKVLVSGFSQGGPAAMALGRALQQGADPRMSLGALAPISGPYDLSDEMALALSGKIDDSAAYVSYLTVAWNKLHHLYRSPADAFRNPAIAALFDGNHPDEQVLAALPATIPELLTPKFLATMQHPRGVLRAALHTADATCAWHPRVPVHLFAANGDHTVYFSNALSCARQLHQRGTAADVTDVGPVDHLASAHLSVPKVLALFDQS